VERLGHIVSTRVATVRRRDQPLWMHFCFALRQETQATGLRIAGDGDGRGHRSRGPEPAALATSSKSGTSRALSRLARRVAAVLRRRTSTASRIQNIQNNGDARSASFFHRVSSTLAGKQGPPSWKWHSRSAIRNMGAPCTRCDAEPRHTIRTRICLHFDRQE
jgi:hypothetical protein